MKDWIWDHLPIIFWRRYVWVTKTGSRVAYYYPFWVNGKKISEADSAFSHWFTYPSGKQPKRRVGWIRRKSVIDQSTPTAADLAWLRNVAEQRKKES